MIFIKRQLNYYVINPPIITFLLIAHDSDISNNNFIIYHSTKIAINFPFIKK